MLKRTDRHRKSTKRITRSVIVVIIKKVPETMASGLNGSENSREK